MNTIVLLLLMLMNFIKCIPFLHNRIGLRAFNLEAWGGQRSHKAVWNIEIKF